MRLPRAIFTMSIGAENDVMLCLYKDEPCVCISPLESFAPVPFTVRVDEYS